MASLAELLSLPMGSRGPGRDAPVGVDEFGRTVHGTATGQQYTMREAPAPTPASRRAAVADAAGDPLGTMGGVLQGLVQALTAPARAARGEPVTNADAFGLAGMLPLGAGAVPAGALGANSVRVTGKHANPTFTADRSFMDQLISEMQPSFGERPHYQDPFPPSGSPYSRVVEQGPVAPERRAAIDDAYYQFWELANRNPAAAGRHLMRTWDGAHSDAERWLLRNHVQRYLDGSSGNAANIPGLLELARYVSGNGG